VYPKPLIAALDGPVSQLTERVQAARELVTTANAAPTASEATPIPAALASEDQK
jgi:hypothetical protein